MKYVHVNSVLFHYLTPNNRTDLLFLSISPRAVQAYARAAEADADVVA